MGLLIDTTLVAWPRAPTKANMLRKKRKLRQNFLTARRGVAAVELAVCLPILTIVSLATIEVCSMMHTSQAMKIASFEAARVGVVPGAQSENVQFQCESLLESRGITAFSISMTPSDPSDLESGDYFRVSIEVDYDENAILGSFLANNRTIERSTALRTD